MESDERFKHLASDPRFKPLRKKKQKVEVDERFKSIFTDEKFSLEPSKDKRGRNKSKTKRNERRKEIREKGEKKEEENEDEEKTERVELTEEKNEDDGTEDEKDEINEIDEAEDAEEAEESDTDVSTSSDEPESDQELASDNEDEGVEINQIQYNWEPLDHDAEQSDSSSNRLAIQNLDWDQLKVEDIYTLINSIRPPLNVRIYISEFAKERLAKEEIEGPQELVEKSNVDEDEEECKLLEEKMRALENQNNKMKQHQHKANEYEDADEVVESANEEVRERIRRYQLNRMKYYYAVAEFDSIESAEVVYKELDGMEYEGSSLELDLRFVPDDIEFDEADIKAECNKLPDLGPYKAPLFINSALQQTSVRFTWDETDVRRQKQLQRAFTKEELDKDDLAAYIASESESEHDEEVVSKYKTLLEGLEAEEEKKKKVGLDVEWDNDEEDEGENYENDDEDEEEDDDEDDSEEEQNDNDDLDLLMMNTTEKPSSAFQFNPDDERFEAVYTSGLYNIDPSHPNFKQTEAFNQIAERKRAKRQKTSSK